MHWEQEKSPSKILFPFSQKMSLLNSCLYYCTSSTVAEKRLYFKYSTSLLIVRATVVYWIQLLLQSQDNFVSVMDIENCAN